MVQHSTTLLRSLRLLRDFVGPRLNDGLYSHGNDYQGWCEHRHAHHMSGPAGAAMAAPTPAVEASPAPAEEPYSPSEPEPYTLPGPGDDMPSEIPYDSSTRMHRDHAGRRVSYEEAPKPKRRAAFQAGGPRSLHGMLQAPVDSRGPSRTLAKPPRTRLFSP